MDNIKLYSYFESCSVKELQRSKHHLEQLIKEKLPDERSVVSNLNVNDFVDYQRNFVSDAENAVLINSLRSHKTFKPASKSSTKSLWLSRTREPYAWTSRKSSTVTHNKAVPITGFPDINAMLDKVKLPCFRPISLFVQLKTNKKWLKQGSFTF